MPTFDVRRARATDAPAIRALAIVNGMFQPDDMADFDAMLSGYYSGELPEHVWLVATTNAETIVAAAYYAPEPFSNGMWNLYFIATEPLAHGTGAGSALIRAVEGELKARDETLARTLIVDTSSMDGYAQARAFYRRHGFVEEARIRDFYGPGDDKVTFWKSRSDF